MFDLKIETAPEWVEAVLADFDRFLIDHAQAEKKASGMAMSMIAHYPDRKTLVRAMTDLALEELIHFKQVMKLLSDRDLCLTADEKDPYVNGLRQCFRRGSDVFFLDRLLVAGVIEARGCERFTLVAEALPEGKMKTFYDTIAKSEAKHHTLFIDLAQEYFDKQVVAQRLEEILTIEADIVANLPHRAALH